MSVFAIFSSRVRVLLLGHFSSRHITLVRKKPFRYLIVHINTHNFIYAVYRTFVCLCVKLSRNAALTPHNLFLALFPMSLSHSDFLPHIFWHYPILTGYSLNVHFAFAQYLNLFYSTSFSHSISHTHSISILFWICPPYVSFSPSLSLVIFWLKRFLSEIDKRLCSKSCFVAATATL